MNKDILISDPLVSIIIPVYNGARYVKKAIDSALKQDYPNFEIIVVDDGSTDNTEQIASSFGEKVKYFKKNNGGVASALNYAISKAQGSYISWLSHDDIYLPYKISKQISFLRENNWVYDVVYSDVEFINAKGESIGATDHLNRHKRELLNIGIYPLIKGMANGCVLLIKKDAFKKVGKFKEELRTANDYDMWFRMFRVTKVGYMPGILIKYRLHNEQGTKTDARYIKESDDLWIRIIKGLSKKEILSIEDSLLAFYIKIAQQMKSSGYKEASDCALRLAKVEYFRKNPRVSVILPCFNTARYLKKAIDSILNQTFVDFELIIINDGSTDDSKEVIEEVLESDFRVRVIENEKNLGISESMNIGLSNAKGEYITRMDSDDIALPDKILFQVEFLDKNKNYGVCTVDIIGIDIKGERLTKSLYPETDIPLNWLFLWRDPIPNAPCMYRRSILKGIKFNTKFNIAEDYDLLTKLVLNTNIYQINKVLYHYRIHDNSIFQRFTKEACLNSIEISRRYAKELTGKEPPIFHDVLTDFYLNLNQKKQYYSPIHMSVWINELLIASMKKWGWTQDEYKKAEDHGSRLLLDYIKLMELIPQEHKINKIK